MSAKSVANRVRRLFGRGSRPYRRPDASRVRPGLESLEARKVPAAYVSYGSLVVAGSDAADVVTIRSERPGDLSSRIKVVENGVTRLFARSSITTGRVYFWGNGGGDSLD